MTSRRAGLGTRSEDVITEGDKVVTRLTASGTHKRDLPGIPARGEHVTISGMYIARYETAGPPTRG